jgi:uncharacterized protein with PIN domain
MLQLLRRYLRLMRTHDFSYSYSDDFQFWFSENEKRIEILMLRSALLLTSRSRWFITRAERRYGHV